MWVPMSVRVCRQQLWVQCCNTEGTTGTEQINLCFCLAVLTCRVAGRTGYS